MAQRTKLPYMSSLKIVLLVLGLPIYLTAATQITVGAGTVPKQGKITSCSDVQEFSCLGNQCDPCSAGTSKCRSPHDGKCLESSWCAPGRHFMPGAAARFPSGQDGGNPWYNQGTPKSFRCIQVSDYTKGDMLWAINEDRDHCYMDSNGVYATNLDYPFVVIDTVPPFVDQKQRCRQSGGDYSDGGPGM